MTTYDFDQRVMGMAPLWMWNCADVLPGPPKSYCIVLRADWENRATAHLWGLSFASRLAYKTHDKEEAIQAQCELNSMIKAARILVKGSA